MKTSAAARVLGGFILAVLALLVAFLVRREYEG